MLHNYYKLLAIVIVSSSFTLHYADTNDNCQAKKLTHATTISIPAAERDALIAILNRSLATLTDLYSATKNAHWNVKGKEFYALHLLFDEIAKGISGFNDIIAERITSLGGTAAGTIQQAVGGTILEQYPADIFSGKTHVQELAQRFAQAGAETRNAIAATEKFGDSATADIFIDITRALDKYLWFLEAHHQ